MVLCGVAWPLYSVLSSASVLVCGDIVLHCVAPSGEGGFIWSSATARKRLGSTSRGGLVASHYQLARGEGGE